jgi:hypothetical protein
MEVLKVNKRKTKFIVITLFIAGIVIPPILQAQSIRGKGMRIGWRGSPSSLQNPALAKDEEEKKILAVLDDIVRNQSDAPGRITGTDKARVLRFLVEVKNAENVVEIGTSVGHSALWMLLGLKATG